MHKLPALNMLLLLLLPQATSGSRQEVVLAASDSLFGEASRIAVAGELSHVLLIKLRHGTLHRCCIRSLSHVHMCAMAANGCCPSTVSQRCAVAVVQLLGCSIRIHAVFCLRAG
jgi:flavoprotein